jgi:SAM-dependent methyltransferase
MGGGPLDGVNRGALYYLCRFMEVTRAREWFEEWFDSPHYHRLYRSRNHEEARLFISHLTAALALPPDAQVLDLACGRGRHASYLASLGYIVTGLDISPSNIAFARRMETERLSFFQHDMRRLFRTNYFDAVFNFFTSFGYFERESEHLQTLINVVRGMKPGGVFVIDFLNAHRVSRMLVPDQVVELDGYSYHIARRVDDRYIHKSIRFEEDGLPQVHHERVRAFTRDNLESLLKEAGLTPTRLYGNYALQPFEPTHSDRLIIVAHKG